MVWDPSGAGPSEHPPIHAKPPLSAGNQHDFKDSRCCALCGQCNSYILADPKRKSSKKKWQSLLTSWLFNDAYCFTPYVLAGLETSLAITARLAASEDSAGFCAVALFVLPQLYALSQCDARASCRLPYIAYTGQERGEYPYSRLPKGGGMWVLVVAATNDSVEIRG